MRYFVRAITLVLFGGMILGTGVSCTDLSENPTAEITQANFNPSEKDIPNLVAPVYTPLRSFMACCYSYIGMQEEAADLFIKPARPNGWGGPYLPYHRHEWDPSHPYTGNYNTFFNGVNAANRVIYQIESGTVPLEDPLRTEVLAELKVARAFYYALLLDNFGNVPIVTDFTLEEAPEQNTRQEVYDFVVQELNDNISDLPETVDQSTYGRFTRWAGHTLLAEVYLNAEVYTGNAEWQNVIDQTDQVISSGRFMLADNYKDNFVRATQRSSSEVIFAIPYEEVNGPGNTFHMQSLTPEIQQAFEMEATPWGGGASQPQFADSYDEDDQRLEDTWIEGEVQSPQGDSLSTYFKNIPRIEVTEFYHGWRIGKFEIYRGMGVSSDVDFPFYRYAEVLMMKAEALLRTGSPGEAASLVTRVRERAFDDPAQAEVTASELQQASTIEWGLWEGPDEPVEGGQVVEEDPSADIEYGRFLDELGWEFALEGHRRQDMIRFQTLSGESAFTTKMWLNHEPHADLGENAHLFPLPQDALDTNPNLEQNPGY